MGKLGTALYQRLTGPFSAAGLILGALFWAAALTPSLIPRDGLLQGAIGGLCFSTGYALAVGIAALWVWLGLPLPPRLLLKPMRVLAAAAAIVIMLAAAFKGEGWQDEVRKALDMQPNGGSWPFVLLIAGVLLIVVLMLAGRCFAALRDFVGAPLRRVLPPRLAVLIAVVAASWIFWSIGNGVLLDALLRGLDSSYRRIDALIPPEEAQPTDPMKAGSAASLVRWEDLGRQGRLRVLSQPTAAEIAALTGHEAKDPLQIYVGLNSADTPQERAALALAELKRTNAFSRKFLVIATPTGTGWVDPAAMLPLEVLTGGDVASVSVQYSYLPSWLTLFVDPQYAEETAAKVFDTVYGHWRSLPKDQRPRLFLFGLSLGSLNSDLATDAYALLGDPFEGALWAGPPFASRTWKQVTATRLTESPAWLPQARTPAVFRFFNAGDRAQIASPGWGPVKIAYLQYPSDAITFFETGMWRREPAWMKAPRGAGVSPALTWYPGITFIQLAFDMMTATTVPKGRGHVYAARDYAAGWRALIRPEGIGEAEMQRLDQWMEGKGL
ncbi:MAG: alpha/beta-hydrolase family protein [Aestuariivirga sp.]|uniref:alpha/beta hydrolase n=1 Tax=Aestuariivirga sp. TaxID=2650926 RepID=UPI0025C64A7C|nr:alpha/beta-hydrolase family protein [Aestuariivirga sp.]MCA3562107.1 alpha/beta-hydrolase family protein [Aestuariivirga sp.]